MELMEQIVSRTNIQRAVEKVRANKGTSGIDGIKVNDLGGFMRQNWERIRSELLGGTYKPQAVKGVKIPKKNGKTRLLGIPTVIDRVIQQAISQVIMPMWEKDFHPHSYGFRPERSTQQAADKALDFINNEKRNFIISLDLSQFFDTVNHDKLMGLLRKKITDKRVLSLIRKFLVTGILLGEELLKREKGTPQGSPLSPLLANILLNVLDWETEKRGISFVRYADDIYIFSRSHLSARRNLHRIKKFITNKLDLVVNMEKTKIVKPKHLRILGFTLVQNFRKGAKGFMLKIDPENWEELKYKLKEITRKTAGMSIQERIDKILPLMRGFVNYYRKATGYEKYKALDAWIRNRLRYCIWHDWKQPQKRAKGLRKLGVKPRLSYQYANTRMGGWAVAQSPIMKTTVTEKVLQKKGYLSFTDYYISLKYPLPKSQLSFTFL